MNEEELIETLKEFEEKRVEQLPENAKNLFYAIMKICDERDFLKEKYDKALEMLAEFDLPCERDNFNIVNADYCMRNCSNDEEQLKRCCDKYIEWKLEEKE